MTETTVPEEAAQAKSQHKAGAWLGNGDGHQIVSISPSVGELVLERPLIIREGEGASGCPVDGGKGSRDRIPAIITDQKDIARGGIEAVCEGQREVGRAVE